MNGVKNLIIASLFMVAALVMMSQPAQAIDYSSCNWMEWYCEYVDHGWVVEGPNMSCGNGWRETTCCIGDTGCDVYLCCTNSKGGCAAPDYEPPTEECG